MRNVMNQWARLTGAAILSVVTAACSGDNGTEPTVGSIQVSVATTGSDLDPDGYAVLVDGGSGQAIGLDGSTTFSNVEAGAHQVSLTGVAANCSVTGANPLSVTVTAGQTAQAAFVVQCVAILGDLEILTVTTGANIDSDGFTFSIDGGSAQVIDVNDAVTLQLATGDRSVQLAGVASNCVVAGDNPRTVTVSASTPTETTFEVSCTGNPGSLVVTTATAGVDLDPDGYAVTVDGGAGQAIGLNAVLTLNSVPAGDRTVELTGLANNCAVSGQNPRIVTVPQTTAVQTDFSIICEPITGSVEVTTTTSGVDIDPDGYTVRTEGVVDQAIDVDASILVTGVVHGDRTVELRNMTSNCSVVNGANPRTVTVPGEGTVQTTFEVSCVALTGNLTVTASTTGGDLDPDGYTVSVDGGPGESLPTNGSFAFSDVETGDRSILLTGNAANCAVTGDNPATVSVPSVGVATHTFDIVCTAVVGSVEVTTSTTGTNLDPDGYTLTVEGETPVPIGINEMTTVNDVSAGDRTVELTGVASNCTVSGQNPRTVTVTDGGTESTTFDVSCAVFLSNQIVFDTDRDSDSEIYVMDPDGGNLQNLTNDPAEDAEPFVSPDGLKVAFVSDRDGNEEIYVMNADGSDPVRLTNDSGSDNEPAWSADGTKIAFSRRPSGGGDRDIWVMDADGSNQTQLTTTGQTNGLPHWSPDGAKIVFNSNRDADGDAEIFVMNANGTGVVQLTFNTVPDFAAAWSPDGTQIAFTSERDGNREIYVMNANGSGQTNLTNNAGSDLAPQWSPDGSQIAFASSRDTNSEVYVMDANGSGQTNITNNAASDFEVSWSP
jgi:Tol biopolymer transport system component